MTVRLIAAIICVWIAWVSDRAIAATSLRVAYPAPTASFLPLWTAQDAGFFKKHDLAVEVIQVGSSTRGMAALLAGQIDVLAGGGTGGIIAQLQASTTSRSSGPMFIPGCFRFTPRRPSITSRSSAARSWA
jgi:ABC-type nitrate/sulfonate/bicarbonate transport system substrate-binding protein